MKKHSHFHPSLRSAFSLIEISIVILIISVLIAGVTQSTKLIEFSKLKAARTLTQSSPVNEIKDIMLWYETSLETSFLDSEQTDGTAITSWNDNNPQSVTKSNSALTNSDGASPCATSPDFVKNVFNGGIPAIRFNGSSDCLRFSGADLIGRDYTIFVVEQRRAATTNKGYFIGGDSNLLDANLFLGYNSDTAIKFSTNSASTADIVLSPAVPAYSTPIPRMHTAISNSSSVKSYWLNGGTAADATASNAATLSSYSGAALGRQVSNSTRYFNGDIGEIIIFTRALKNEERQAVESYLSKKYGIAIS